MTPATSIVHIGLCVPDLDVAIDWYTSILGFDLLAGPVDLEVDGGEEGEAAADVFGPEFRRARMAHLTGANGAALEMFEFVEPRQEQRSRGFLPLEVGISHVCVLARDVRATAARIVESGGRQTSRVWHTVPGREYEFVWCEDPFGIPLELYSHSHERVYANSDAH